MFNFSKKKREHQVAHSVSCQLEYSGERLSPFTYKCHLLSSQGLGKVLLSPQWCTWQTFLPCLETSLWCTVRKWEETQCILPLVPSLCLFFSFTCHWYALICVSRLVYIGFVRISLKDEAACCLKRLSCSYWGGLMVRLPSMEGFCFGGGIINEKQMIWVSKTANREGKMQITPKTVWHQGSCSKGDDGIICIQSNHDRLKKPNLAVQHKYSQRCTGSHFLWLSSPHSESAPSLINRDAYPLMHRDEQSAWQAGSYSFLTPASAECYNRTAGPLPFLLLLLLLLLPCVPLPLSQSTLLSVSFHALSFSLASYFLHTHSLHYSPPPFSLYP